MWIRHQRKQDRVSCPCRIFSIYTLVGPKELVVRFHEPARIRLHPVLFFL